MNRRSFLTAAVATAVTLAVDPEQLLWTPGTRTHFLPPAGGWFDDWRLVDSWIDYDRHLIGYDFGATRVDDASYMFRTEHISAAEFGRRYPQRLQVMSTPLGHESTWVKSRVIEPAVLDRYAQDLADAIDRRGIELFYDPGGPRFTPRAADLEACRLTRHLVEQSHRTQRIRREIASAIARLKADV